MIAWLGSAGRWLAQRPGAQLVLGAAVLALAFPARVSGELGLAVLGGALGVAVLVAWPYAPDWLRSPPGRTASALVVAVVVAVGISVFRDALTESPDWQMGDWGPQRAVLSHVMPSLHGLPGLLDVPVWNHAVSTVLMRKDPPVDVSYLHATWILEHARGKTLLVNDPRGLRELNEHLAVLHFPELTPPTIVTRSAARLREFQNQQGGAIVVKPVDGYGGLGIFVVRDGDPNASSIIETSTGAGTRWTLAQRYLPEAASGDKRIVLADGEPLGAVLRVRPRPRRAATCTSAAVRSRRRSPRAIARSSRRSRRSCGRTARSSSGST